MPSISEQVSFYNDFWKDHTRISYWGMERTGVILTELARQRVDSPTILDLGSGTGWMSNILSAYGEVTGVELSADAVEKARKNFPQATFYSGDFFTIDFPKQFDFIVVSEVLEHFEDQKALVARIAELLRPGGAVVITTPNRLLRHEADVDGSLDGRWQPIENWRSPAELKALLAPYFNTQRQYSIELGWGHSGTRRILNSTKLRQILYSLGLGYRWDEWRRNRCDGLHLVNVSTRRVDD